MTDMERRTAAAKFAADGQGQGDEKQQSMIEQTAQASIDTRALYPDANLADYTMKPLCPRN